MKVEATVPPVHPPPRSAQDVQVKTIVTEGKDGRTKVTEVHYATTIYDQNGQKVNVTRTWTVDYLV